LVALTAAGLLETFSPVTRVAVAGEAGFFAAGLTTFTAAAFLVTGFFWTCTAVFFMAGFLATDFFAAGVFAADFTGFLEAGFLVAGFFFAVDFVAILTSLVNKNPFIQTGTKGFSAVPPWLRPNS
jgi:hypothetical protein